MDNKFINQLICGNNIEIIKQMAPNSVDLIFADPPYYMNLQKQLLRPMVIFLKVSMMLEINLLR